MLKFTEAPPPAWRPASAGTWITGVWGDVAVAALGLLALIAWDHTGGDLRVAQWFGSAGGFVWRDAWLTANVLHEGGRMLGYVALAALFVHLLRPLPFAATMTRGSRVWWVLATLSCALLIPLIKSRSLVSCPWDLAHFGGSAQYLPHWSWQAWVGLGDGGSGRCFPSGHASTAFSFVTGWFVLRAHSLRVALAWLLGVFVIGLAFGLAQVARGAHYPSHVGWTAWVCWAVGAITWHVAQYRWRGRVSVGERVHA